MAEYVNNLLRSNTDQTVSMPVIRDASGSVIDITSYEFLARFYTDSAATTAITTTSTFTVAGGGITIDSGPAGTWSLVVDAADFTSEDVETALRVELDLHSDGNLGNDPTGKREYILPFKPGT